MTGVRDSQSEGTRARESARERGRERERESESATWASAIATEADEEELDDNDLNEGGFAVEAITADEERECPV